MGELTRQQLCAEMTVSESTVMRWERDGLPYTPIGKRGKRYNLDECKQWLRSRGPIVPADHASAPWPGANAFTEYCRKVKLRVYPSER